jgi:hypothetical protein
MQMRSRSNVRLAKHKNPIPNTTISSAENGNTSVAPCAQKKTPIQREIALMKR